MFEKESFWLGTFALIFFVTFPPQNSQGVKVLFLNYIH